MPFFDLPLDQLKAYRGAVPAPADFDAFWQSTLADARSRAWTPRFSPRPAGLRGVRIFDLSFAGWNGEEIKGWFVLPSPELAARSADCHGRLPCVVEFIGYGGGRGYPHSWLGWANLGFAFCVMDSRGQGSGWQRGDTPDPDPWGYPQYPGMMTRGIRSKESYYYRRIMTDAARAVEAAASHPEVDPERMYLTGGSQGGGLAIAACGLLEGPAKPASGAPQVRALLPDVPFLCDMRRACGLVASHPYHEIALYLRQFRLDAEAVYGTLAYFDGVNFAQRCRAPAHYSVGLMDDVCPPSTVFAAWNNHGGPKTMDIYSHNQHEGGQALHEARRFAYALRSEGRADQAAEIDYIPASSDLG